jgi:osmoprotectant transport system ATP-binding protein
MLRFDEVEKAFEGRPVIQPTTLEVADGERLALIGPSGCGKSTLLKMVVGLVTPDRGRVIVGDIEVTEETAPAVRRRIGYVIQDGGLFPHLTAEENVTLVGRLAGDRPEKLRERMRELAQIARLPEQLFTKYPQRLSGGERQRVGLVRALMRDPDVLLLDEPLGALDPIVRARLQEDLRDAFAKLKKCVLLVTHDMAEAAYLADTIAVIREGTVVQRGTMSELVEHPKHPFVGEFVGAQRSLSESLR